MERYDFYRGSNISTKQIQEAIKIDWEKCPENKKSSY
jgi:hypothetical protein